MVGDVVNRCQCAFLVCLASYHCGLMSSAGICGLSSCDQQVSLCSSCDQEDEKVSVWLMML